MDFESLWDKALKGTEVVRSRITDLATFEATPLPYIFVAESSVNAGDTVVRQGQVMVERAALIMPTPRFEGFELEDGLQVSEDALLNFFLVRGIRFPSLRYRHEHSSLTVREGSLQQAVTFYREQLQQREDVHTGLVLGPEDAWQLSILILVGQAVVRSAEGDVRRLLDEWRRKHEH
jgi:hypothetical protein